MTERNGERGQQGLADEPGDEPKVAGAAGSELANEQDADLAADDRRETEKIQRRPAAPEIPTGIVPVKPFAPERITEFRARWSRVQESFVDDPRRSIEQAGMLVQDVIRELGAASAKEKSELERRVAGGDAVSTEELRVALRRYKSFFDRLLTL